MAIIEGVRKFVSRAKCGADRVLVLDRWMKSGWDGGAGLTALTVVVVEWSAAEQAVLDRGVPVPAGQSNSLREAAHGWAWIRVGRNLSDPAAMMNSRPRPRLAAVVSPAERVEVLFGWPIGLCAIDGRIVEIVWLSWIDGLWETRGRGRWQGCVTWKMGCSSRQPTRSPRWRLPEVSRCARGMREGRLSLDQVGMIAGAGGSVIPVRS